MTAHDYDAFIGVVMGFAELKGKQLSAPAIELYWRAMQRWDIEDFKRAAEHLLRTCEFMPTPKDFEDLRKAGRQTAGEAWARVLDFVRKGYYRWDDGSVSMRQNFEKPRLDDLTERAVAALGGYGVIAMSPSDRTHFLERRFAEHYESLEDAKDIREAVPQIAFDLRRRLEGPTRVRNMLPELALPEDSP